MKILSIILPTLCLLSAIQTAAAIPIASNFSADTTNNFIPGQSFSVAAPGPVDHIIFNFYSDIAATIPTAFGNGYLLASQYLGAPNGLSAATPGFLAQTVAAGGFYTFAPSLTLNPATTYFFYADTAGTLTGSLIDNYPQGLIYFSFNPALNYNPNPGDTTFQVQGTLVAGAPELSPESAVSAGALLFCLLALSSRRRPALPRPKTS